MIWREVFGSMTAIGLLVLIWDLATIGRGETRTAVAPESLAAAPAAA